MLHGQFKPGEVIDQRYRIVSLLGKGGMGEVYRADDLKLKQAVALKMLPPELAEDQKLLQSLFNEVRQARRVSHHHVCRVHDVGEWEGNVFLSMEFIEGEDLSALLRRIGRAAACPLQRPGPGRARTRRRARLFPPACGRGRSELGKSIRVYASPLRAGRRDRRRPAPPRGARSPAATGDGRDLSAPRRSVRRLPRPTGSHDAFASRALISPPRFARGKSENRVGPRGITLCPS